MRIETDSIGTREIPDHALYGIHALRAKENFPDTTPFQKEWYQAVGLVKQACYLTCKKYYRELRQKYGDKSWPFLMIQDDILDALIRSSVEVGNGEHFDDFIVPAVSGGAGTSINMNVNEIIANRALILMQQVPGKTKLVDPTVHSNVFQSTNDVIPTALKVAVMKLLEKLEVAINQLRAGFELLETGHRATLRIGYTQMQEAVPSSYGKLFSAYSESLSRDWWRVSKCFERIKTVNLGGGAIGTGMGVPRYFIMEVVQELQKLTDLPITRAENMEEATSNLDAWVEVHAILKTHAVNLEKISADLRVLASDLTGGEVIIPARQVGSSIMPGKINPVIAEFVISAAHKVYTNDILIAQLCGQGCLELNAYLPLIGHSILESLNLLMAADSSLLNFLVKDLKVNAETSYDRLIHCPAITTALSPFIGYHQATTLAAKMKAESCNVFEANQMLDLVSNTDLTRWLNPGNLLKMGFTISDLNDDHETTH